MIDDVQQLFDNFAANPFSGSRVNNTPQEIAAHDPTGNPQPQGWIAKGAIDNVASFASTIRPVILVTALPALPSTSYPIGQFVYKTNDTPPRLYKNVADAWVAAVGPNDIQADSITAGQIAAGAISASEIAAGAVLTEKLAVGAVTSDKVSGMARNLLSNPGWEEGTGSVPTFWSGDRTTEAPRSGAYNGKVGAGQNYLVSQTFKVLGGRRYYGSVWGRGNSGNTNNDNMALRVRWFDNGGTQIGADINFDQLAYGQNNTYRNFRNFVVAPTTAASCFVFCVHDGAGAVHNSYWDEAEFYSADEDVSHAGGNVVIDSTGITISNGKLVLQDEFGATTMVASGFSGSWGDFVGQGLYNSRFNGVVGSLPNGRTSAMPYWTVDNTTSRILTAKTGGGVRATWSALDNSAVTNMLSDAVPMIGGTLFEVAYYYQANVAAGTIGLNAFANFYDSAGALIESRILAGVSETVPTGPETSDRDSIVAPTNTASVKIALRFNEAGTHSASNWFDILGIAIVRSGGSVPPELRYADAAMKNVSVASGTLNDWALGQADGSSGVSILRVTITGGSTEIIVTGIQAPRQDKKILEIYLYSGTTIVFQSESASSAAANRITMPVGIASVPLSQSGTVRLWYDALVSRWRLLSHPGSNRGTAFPGSPSTDDLYYRRDRKMWFQYDGTRWVCTCPHSAPFSMWVTAAMALSATATDRFGVVLPVDRGMDILVESYECFFAVEGGGTALDASNKWVGTVNIRPTGTAVATLNIDSGASSTHRTVVDATDDVIDLTAAEVGMTVTWTKTGTPGALEQAVTVNYRFIG